MIVVMPNAIGRLLIPFVCFACSWSMETPTALTNDHYGVYSAYLARRSFNENTPLFEGIILADSTTMHRGDIDPKTPWLWVRANLGDCCLHSGDTISCRKAKDDAWAPLFEKIKQTPQRHHGIIPSKLNVNYSVQLFSEWKKQPEASAEREPFTHYYVGLSEIAFDRHRTKALFFGSFICGGKCGRGELVMLEKVDSKWIIIDTFRFWIA